MSPDRDDEDHDGLEDLEDDGCSHENEGVDVAGGCALCLGCGPSRFLSGREIEAEAERHARMAEGREEAMSEGAAIIITASPTAWLATDDDDIRF